MPLSYNLTIVRDIQRTEGLSPEFEDVDEEKGTDTTTMQVGSCALVRFDVLAMALFLQCTFI